MEILHSIEYTCGYVAKSDEYDSFTARGACPMTRNKKLEVTEEKVPVEAAKRIVVNADLAGPYAEELESKLCVALAAPVQGPLILDLKRSEALTRTELRCASAWQRNARRKKSPA
jgi:hypothetical protein